MLYEIEPNLPFRSRFCPVCRRAVRRENERKGRMK